MSLHDLFVLIIQVVLIACWFHIGASHYRWLAQRRRHKGIDTSR